MLIVGCGLLLCDVFAIRGSLRVVCCLCLLRVVCCVLFVDCCVLIVVC